MRRCASFLFPFFAGCTLLPDSVAPPEGANAVAVPPGHERALTLEAKGTVNFECRARAGMAGAYMWTVSAPDATLRHWTGWPMGRLYEGPTWAHRDGSVLTGKLLGAVSGGPGKLQDQLWKVAPSGKPGAFSGIAFIRRTNALGGAPPAQVCTEKTTGTAARSDYAAEYSFFGPTRP
jgi:hypothetical protein